MIDDIPIPPRLAYRPRDHRGYVVPYAQFIDNDGVPKFQVMDDTKVRKCLVHRWCGLCGQPMGKHIYFVGGLSCEANGYFYDPPMHLECAEFALRTCPHLARSKGRYGAIPDVADIPGAAKLVVGAMCTEVKADIFALMHGSRFTYGRDKTGMYLIKAELPWLDVQHWRDGARVPGAL